LVVNPQVVKSRIAKIEECAGRLREIVESAGPDPFADRRVQAESERLVQVAIQSVLDLGIHLISGYGFREPMTYAEIFDVLGEEGVIPGKFAVSIRGMAGLRNILVHDYLEVDPVKLRRALRKVGDFEKFCRYVIKFLDG
jgi:uncharacterized protein YutE (UPF0331/DUF86 family)